MIIIQENIRGNIKKYEETEEQTTQLIGQILKYLVDKIPFNITYM